MGNARKVAVGDAKPRCGCCCRFCPTVALITGVILVLFGIWSVHLKDRFTPVYTDITCSMEPAKLEDLQLFGGFQFTLKTTTTCTNPNPYALKLASTHPGHVYMGQRMTEVGTLTQVPETTLPANGEGSITAYVTVVPTGDLITTGLGFLFQGQVPIYLESRMKVIVDIKFLFGTFKTTKNMDRDCGFNLKMPALGSREPRWGSMACGENFAELQLPPVRGEVDPNELHLGGPSLAGAELEQATKLKDMSLGICIVVGFGLGAVLLICGAVGLALQCRRGRRQAQPQKEPQAQDLEQDDRKTLPTLLRPASEARQAQGLGTDVAKPAAEPPATEIGALSAPAQEEV